MKQLSAKLKSRGATAVVLTLALGAAEDWAYVTAKCKEALGYIAEARANK